MRETFCGETANSLAGSTAREFSRAAKPGANSTRLPPFFSRPARLFALAFGTDVRAGPHSRRLRRLAFLENFETAKEVLRDSTRVVVVIVLAY